MLPPLPELPPNVAGEDLTAIYPIQAAVVGTTNAVLQCVIAFGIGITAAENAAVTTAVNSALILVAVLLLTRKRRAAIAAAVPPRPPAA